MISFCLDSGVFLSSLVAVRISSLIVGVVGIAVVLMIWRHQDQHLMPRVIHRGTMVVSLSWHLILMGIAGFVIAKGCEYRLTRPMTIIYGSAYVWSIAVPVIMLWVMTRYLIHEAARREAENIVASAEIIEGTVDMLRQTIEEET